MRACSSWMWVVAVAALCMGSIANAGEAGDMTGYFPDFNEWKKDGAPQTYTPENLFEYIDGAADVYLSYEFEALGTLNYDRGEKQSVTIDIYRHRDLRNAFGIYSQEKPLTGSFIPIGTQGYYDKGVLNFFQGPYYVKLMGFYLEDQDERTLKTMAKAVAKRIGGEAGFPAALQCFPSEKKIPNSERFLARDVFGHGFLHSAYTADYQIGDASVRVFLFEGDDGTDTQKMLDAYLQIAGKSGLGPDEKGIFRFTDPRRSSGEAVHLRKQGRYMWGLYTNDDATADSFVEALGKNLGEHGLIN